jgi:hypothetical protein
LAAKTGSVHVEEGVVKAMKDVRDDASHASSNLVSSYADVTKLAYVKRECLRVIGAAQQS